MCLIEHNARNHRDVIKTGFKIAGQNCDFLFYNLFSNFIDAKAPLKKGHSYKQFK